MLHEHFKLCILKYKHLMYAISPEKFDVALWGQMDR